VGPVYLGIEGFGSLKVPPDSVELKRDTYRTKLIWCLPICAGFRLHMANVPSIIDHINAHGWGHSKLDVPGVGFRFKSKAGFLTYPALTTQEAKSPFEFFHPLVGKISGGADCDVIVALETHANPASATNDKHIHVAFWSKAVTETRNHKYFDLIGDSGRALHPFIVVPNSADEDKVCTLTMHQNSSLTHHLTHERNKT